MKQYYGSSYVILLLALKLYTAHVSTFTATFHYMQDDGSYEKDVIHYSINKCNDIHTT
jgi:hypothetical protein